MKNLKKDSLLKARDRLSRLLRVRLDSRDRFVRLKLYTQNMYLKNV